MGAPERRLVITVCPREAGVVRLPITRGARAVRLDAAAVARELTALAARRGLEAYVRVREGCAGGCYQDGPNVDVRSYAAPGPGERADEVAVGFRTYVYSLATLESLADVIDESLPAPPARRAGR